ncbi:MAG: hypothetical protein K2H29_11015 [Oscillospiraceae bacterium]|nr:hypothetical protein [Oscillospiraceae bacterium]
MELIHNCKIKIVCKLENHHYQENLYLDNKLQEKSREQDSGVQIGYQTLQSAKRFFHAFSPEILLRDLCACYGENSVLVFRTTEQQMKNFCEINFQDIFTENA